MRITSVNIGEKSPLAVGKRQTQTGIFKQQVNHAVEVKPLGITGDKVLDTRHHGGLDQALYLYRAEDYEFWANQLGRSMPPGMFGENLTITGLPSAGLNVGDRLRLPNLLLEITAPRIPCNTLAARMGEPGFVKAFVKAERPGFYVRVIEAGKVSAGDSVELKVVGFESVSIVEFYRDLMRKLDEATLQRYLALPIDIRTRKDFESRLAAL